MELVDEGSVTLDQFPGECRRVTKPCLVKHQQGPLQDVDTEPAMHPDQRRDRANGMVIFIRRDTIFHLPDKRIDLSFGLSTCRHTDFETLNWLDNLAS